MFLKDVLPVCDRSRRALEGCCTGNWRSHADSANPSAFTDLSEHGVGGYRPESMTRASSGRAKIGAIVPTALGPGPGYPAA